MQPNLCISEKHSDKDRKETEAANERDELQGNKHKTDANFSPETEARRVLKECICRSRTVYRVKLFKTMVKQHLQKKTGEVPKRSNQKKYLSVFFSQNKHNFKWKFADAKERVTLKRRCVGKPK